MPLIKARANRVRTVRHICRLVEPNRDMLGLGARFIGDTPDYVANQLIESTLAKDRQFVTWRAEHECEDGTAAAQPTAAATAACTRVAVEWRPGTIRALVAQRLLLSLGCSAVVGTLGLQAYPFPGTHPPLGRIDVYCPVLFAASPSRTSRCGLRRLS